MKKWIFRISLIYALPAFCYCTPDNITCFNCGINCIAELTYTKDANNQDIGTMTVYGTGANGVGQMGWYNFTGSEPNRTTTAPWKDKLGDINNVVIQNGVTNVGFCSFTGAKNIVHLELPESVENVGAYAFMDSVLETVNTLKNVKNIGDGAFYLTNLSSVDLSDELETIEAFVFGYTNLTTLDVPDAVKYIGEYAFASLPENAKVYCNNIGGRCDALFNGEINTSLPASKLVKYTKDSLYFYYDGQKYHSLDDMRNGKYVRRIYTVKEAIAASKPTGNRVSIRYK